MVAVAIAVATTPRGFSMGRELNREVYRLIINQTTGLVDEVKVVKSPPYAILNEYAAKAYFQWKFQPGTVREAVIPFEWRVHGISHTLH